jgi:hypothetical protein
MLTKGLSRTLTGYLFAVLFAVIVAGCGESSDSGANGTTLRVDLVARTGGIVAVRVGEMAILDGSKSTSPSTTVPLSYSWSFSSKPDASDDIVSQLQNATTATPSFTADARGAYMVQLVVSAGGVSSQRDLQLVVATIDPERITGPIIHQGLSSNCVQCHNGQLDIDPLDPGRGKIPGKSPDHVATSNTCETCHTPMGFTIASPSLDAAGNPVILPPGVGPFISFVDHEEVLGNCSTCHNGVLAIGKSEFHVPTVVECDNCHDTTNFLKLAADGTLDHTGISSGCIVCHNGNVAIGKDAKINPDHITTDSDCIFCHLAYAPPTTIDFTGGFPDHTDPVILAARCDSCHDGIAATGKIDAPTPPGHLVTSTDCALCHNTSNFTDAFVDHSGSPVTDVGITCDSCHDGIAATGLSQNHISIQIANDCVDCHTPGGTFAGGVFDHFAAGIVDSCDSCHDGVVAIGKNAKTNPAHIPTTVPDIPITITDCSGCHDNTNFTSFTGVVFHQNVTVTNNCASCHASGLAPGKMPDHIPAVDECSDCHNGTNTGGFAVSTFFATDHPGLTIGCEGCHNGQFNVTSGTVLGKSVGHLPTAQDCYLCHTTIDPFTSPITPFTHTGISGNCVSCHDGSASFVALGARGKAQDPTPPHPATTADCGVCHNTSGTFADAIFDHTGRVDNCTECHGDGAVGAVTKKDIGHVLTAQDCSVCHVTGTFAPAVFDHTDIVDNCASCHGVTATGSPNDPIHLLPPIEDCSVCHNTTAFAGAKFDHDAAGVVDNCASCHDNNTAIGKGTNHVLTPADCSVCHQTTGFVPGTFDHVGIVDNCVSCHDGDIATGKTPTPPHPVTALDCGACHNPQGFIPVTFDHSNIVDNCVSCHDGNPTIGAPNDTIHQNTTGDCISCHTTATFVGGAFNHQGIVVSCATCHDGAIAIGQSGNHFETTQACDACHSTQGWAPIDFTHQSINYPGDHNSNVGCISCHKNKRETINYPSALPLCAGCHERDYEPGPHKWYENPSTKYPVSELADCAGACHVYSDATLNTRVKTRNSEHRVSDRDFD